MNRLRVVGGAAVIVVGVAFALLWDPTVLVQPSYLPENTNPPIDYLIHEYVPLRLGVALLAVVVGILILSLRPKDRTTAGAST